MIHEEIVVSDFIFALPFVYPVTNGCIRIHVICIRLHTTCVFHI